MASAKPELSQNVKSVNHYTPSSNTRLQFCEHHANPIAPFNTETLLMGFYRSDNIRSVLLVYYCYGYGQQSENFPWPWYKN